LSDVPVVAVVLTTGDSVEVVDVVVDFVVVVVVVAVAGLVSEVVMVCGPVTLSGTGGVSH